MEWKCIAVGNRYIALSIRSFDGDAKFSLAFCDSWWRRSLDMRQWCKEASRRNSFVSELRFILKWVDHVMHLLGINQWLFIGYFVGRWINFICMSEKAWIFLPLHMGSGGDANVRKSFLASWVGRASPDRLGVSRFSLSRDDMMRRLSKMWFSARITCAQLWEWYTIDASLRGIIHQSVTSRKSL